MGCMCVCVCVSLHLNQYGDRDLLSPIVLVLVPVPFSSKRPLWLIHMYRDGLEFTSGDKAPKIAKVAI